MKPNPSQAIEVNHSFFFSPDESRHAIVAWTTDPGKLPGPPF